MEFICCVHYITQAEELQVLFTDLQKNFIKFRYALDKSHICGYNEGNRMTIIGGLTHG